MEVLFDFVDFVCVKGVDAVEIRGCALAERLLGLELLEESHLVLSLLGVFSTFLFVLVR